MGRVTTTLDSPVYLDTNVFVYFLEGNVEYESVLKELFGDIEREELIAVTSQLTLAEGLVKPIRDGRNDASSAFDMAIRTSRGLDVVSISREVLIEAASIRAKSSVKLPDAIHLATATMTQCRSFLTNDRSIPHLSGLSIIYINDLAGIK